MGARDYNWTIIRAIANDRVAIVKLMLPVSAYDYDELVLYARDKGRPEIAKIIQDYAGKQKL